jgi:hypothetical protein
MWIAIAVFAALSLWAALTSNGFLEADACTHYLYARFALRGSPHFLVNVWGRPLFTTLYSIPSAFGGLMGARVTSLVVAIACSLVAQRIARNQGYRWPALALILTLGQPLVFLHSFSELTELLFATLLGLAFLAYQSRRWLLFALVASVLPLSRPEGFGFLILAGVALTIHRRPWWILLLPLALVGWDIVGWMMFGCAGPWWKWLINTWPYSGQSLYKPGNPLHFVMLMPAVTSPLVFPATCIGTWLSLRSRDVEAHRRRCQQLIAVLPLLILIGHSILYATGTLASSGEIRYMLIVAPFWGLLAARGWEWAWESLNWRAPLRWAGVAVLAAVVANSVYPVLPLAPTDDMRRAMRFVDLYRSSGLADTLPRVSTGEVAIFYLLDVSPADSQSSMEYRRDLLASPQPRTIVVSDPIYSMYNADQNRSMSAEELIARGWVELNEFTDVEGGWRFFRAP